MYIIGDLHSNVRELNELLEQLRLTKGDSLIFLGDYIDKGRETNETLNKLKSLKKRFNCTFIKGDHEYVWERYLDYGEIFRKDFLLKYGSVEALREYSDNPEKLIADDDTATIKRHLQPYLDFIKDTKDYYFIDKYLMLHAGLTEDQLSQNPIKFIEINYFLRKDDMNLKRLYLDKYIVVAGHTYFGEDPFVQEGYIGIDLGTGYGGYLGAFDPKKNKLVRSDGKIFDLNQKHD